jgi:hypothetical protein
VPSPVRITAILPCGITVVPAGELIAQSERAPVKMYNNFFMNFRCQFYFECILNEISFYTGLLQEYDHWVMFVLQNRAQIKNLSFSF